MAETITITVEDVGARLDAFLASATERSREFVKEQIAAGRVSVNGRPVIKASTKVRAGDTIETAFVEDSIALDLAPVPGDLQILFEDESLLAINKAQGVVVHPASGHRGPTLVHYLLHHLRYDSEFPTLSDTRPGIVHRLDRGTSGVLVIAKNRRAQEELSRQFKAREIKKEYEAIAWGTMKAAGKIESVIGRDLRDRKKMSTRTASGRASLTHYKNVETFAHFTHVALLPHTGRTHQLRVHLTELGFPIVGDALYGGGATPRRRAPLGGRLLALVDAAGETFLHAKRLHLSHPMSKQPISLEAPRPGVFEAFLAVLRSDDR